MRLNDLIDKTLAIIKVRGYTEGTWQSHFRNGRFSSIRQYFEERGAYEFDFELANEYIAALKRRYENKEFSYSRFAHLRKLALWLIEVHATGDLPHTNLKNSKIVVNQYFEGILRHHLSTKEESKHPKNIERQKSVTLQFMEYLQNEKGYTDFSVLSLKDIQDFILFTRNRRKGRIDSQVYALKRFLIYLKGYNIISVDLTPALYLKPPIKRKLMIGFTHDEVNRVLAQPNRDMPVGKRDYAILMLAKATGLRIGDIIHLKLTDIDWKRDEIILMQGKTGHQLVLPLEEDTEHAIVDYIRNARPKCNLPYLFLRHNAPLNALSQQMVTTLFTKYRTAAEVSHTIGDGKTFHGLRRSIASWMLEADIPLTTISQILGHRSMDSAKPYLSFDEKNLRKCSLSLGGIGVAKEGLR